MLRLEFERPLEGGLGVRGDLAAGDGGNGFAEPGFAGRRRAEQLDRLLICHDGIVVAADPQIDRRQHVPAAAVIRKLLKMRLGARDQLVDRLFAGSTASRAASGCDGMSGEPSAL